MFFPGLKRGLIIFKLFLSGNGGWVGSGGKGKNDTRGQRTGSEWMRSAAWSQGRVNTGTQRLLI